MTDRHIEVPVTKEDVVFLKAGDYIYLTGTIYTARGAAHKRMNGTLDQGEELSFNIKDSTIYYLGPSPAGEEGLIGLAGSTTTSRMDKYTPRPLDIGMRTVIGGRKRSQAAVGDVVRNKSMYFATVGGVGAILSRCILSLELIAYGNLGAEAIYRLETRDFPVVVVTDSQGSNPYETAVKGYCTI